VDLGFLVRAQGAQALSNQEPNILDLVGCDAKRHRSKMKVNRAAPHAQLHGARAVLRERSMQTTKVHAVLASMTNVYGSEGEM
jgi:hypothetical protein